MEVNADLKLSLFYRVFREVLPQGWMVFERDGVFGIIDRHNTPTTQAIQDLEDGLALLEQSAAVTRRPQ